MLVSKVARLVQDDGDPLGTLAGGPAGRTGRPSGAGAAADVPHVDLPTGEGAP